MDDFITINKIVFPKRLFNSLMKVFKESLSHTSLSCENAFTELKQKERELIEMYVENSREIYESLPKTEKERIDFMLKFFLVYEAASKAAIRGDFRRVDLNDPNTKAMILNAYEENLKEYDLLIHDIIIFTEDNTFDERQTFRNIIKLFKVYSERKVLYETAHSMKKDHIDAFEYALDLGRIGIPEIKEINRRVNKSQPEREDDFKRVNNIITGAGFETASKEETTQRMLELFYNYDKNFGDEPFVQLHSGSSKKEKSKRMHQVMLREAKFHIDFIRIHPFADGNGRTGRIILNKNLIDQGYAPVLITDEMFQLYKHFIAECDYEGLANCLKILSSQQQSIWVSQLREYFKMSSSSIDPIERPIGLKR